MPSVPVTAGAAGLVHGIGVTVGQGAQAYGYFSSLEFTEEVEVSEAKNADGDIIAATFHGRKYSVSGSYVYSDQVTVPGTQSTQGIGSPDKAVGNKNWLKFLVSSDSAGSFDPDRPGWTIYVTKASTKYSAGEYKVVDFEGVGYPNLQP